MSSHELFIELFPIETAVIPELTAYTINFGEQDARPIGGRLAYRLKQTFPGNWIWADNLIITDTPIAPTQLEISVDILRTELPDLYGSLEAIEEDPRWHVTPRVQANYVIWSLIRPIEESMRTALAKMSVAVESGRAEREYDISTWIVDGQPALSLSIHSHLLHDANLQQYLTSTRDPEAVIGLRVIDKTSTMVGDVTRITGTLAERRDDLLQFTRREVMQTILKFAPDEELVVEVVSDKYTYEYPASALHILIRLFDEADQKRFNISAKHAMRSLRLRPDARSHLVRVVSDILKGEGLIGNGYNIRTHPHLFMQASFESNLRFANNRVHPHDFQTLNDNFANSGVYKRQARFEKEPIRVAVINTLEEPIRDFVEAMRRELERRYEFQIELLKERKVRVLSQKNLESALRVVEKEDPQVVLAFFPDHGLSDEDDDASYRHLKSLTLGKGIASQAVYYATMHNPQVMGNVIMGILAKTGNIPYILAEPLEYADYVVGLDIVRQQLKMEDRVTAIARIYQGDGEFQHYILHHIDLDPGEPVPFVVMQTLFPDEMFKGKKVIIHHNGVLHQAEASILQRWADVLKASFYPVEIIRHHVPRMYAFEQKQITHPQRGSAFRLDDTEAFLVTSEPDPESTPIPLRIRVAPGTIPIEAALHSVMMWTMLHYGVASPPKLPVTVRYASEMAEWLAKGVLPSETAGDVPFWL